MIRDSVMLPQLMMMLQIDRLDKQISNIHVQCDGPFYVVLLDIVSLESFGARQELKK